MPPGATYLAQVGESVPAAEAVALPFSESGAALGVQLMSLIVIAGLLVGLPLLRRILRESAPWARGVSCLNWRPVLLADMGRLLLLILGVQILGQALLALSGSELPFGFQLVFQVFTFHAVVFAYVWVALRRKGLTWSSLFGQAGRSLGQDLGQGALAYLAAMPVVLVASLIYNIALNFVEASQNPQAVFEVLGEGQSPLILLAVVVVSVVLAPLVEEILFRGLLLAALSRWLGPGVAVLGSSFVFALIHMHLRSFVALFVLGMAFALAYLYTRSLRVPIVMHALFNAVSMLQFGLGVYG